MERTGLEFIVECNSLSEAVYVDREMWEKIVLSLVSNAFLEGTVMVQVAEREGGAAFSVTDTGAGIPDAELPRLFERFHRVEVTRGRTHEGTGIGLPLVQELVRLHGGAVSVTSTVRKGSSFVVFLPFGTNHLPQDRVGSERNLRSTALHANSFVEEALRWLPDCGSAHPRTFDEPRIPRGRRRSRSAAACCWPTTMPTCVIMCGDYSVGGTTSQRLRTETMRYRRHLAIRRIWYSRMS